MPEIREAGRVRGGGGTRAGAGETGDIGSWSCEGFFPDSFLSHPRNEWPVN